MLNEDWMRRESEEREIRTYHSSAHVQHFLSRVLHGETVRESSPPSSSRDETVPEKRGTFPRSEQQCGERKDHATSLTASQMMSYYQPGFSIRKEVSGKWLWKDTVKDVELASSGKRKGWRGMTRLESNLWCAFMMLYRNCISGWNDYWFLNAAPIYSLPKDCIYLCHSHRTYLQSTFLRWTPTAALKTTLNPLTNKFINY